MESSETVHGIKRVKKRKYRHFSNEKHMSKTTQGFFL